MELLPKSIGRVRGNSKSALLAVVFVNMLVLGVLQPAADAQSDAWTWTGGANTNDQAGVYGTLQTSAPSNIPGARQKPVTWTGKDGNLWLFGGQGLDSSGILGDMNDLWQLNPSTHEWTWMGGSSTFARSERTHPGAYGPQGIFSAANFPGSKVGAVGWTDSQGDLWLFGGQGIDATGAWGDLNDLWEYDPSINQWAWVAGGSTLTAAGKGQPGVYGTLGTPAATNIPGGRYGAVAHADGDGNVWLFGGYGSDSLGAEGALNDLWEFNPSNRQWAWKSGSSTVSSCASSGGSFCVLRGVYGTLGTPAAGNVPGSRQSGALWTGKDGRLWLFGGVGQDSVGSGGYLNDLWNFNRSTGEWTWVAGSSIVAPNGGQPGVYGTYMTPAPGTVPGGRRDPASWTDDAGNLWLLGGFGVDSPQFLGSLNDLWKFNPVTTEWAWMGGSTTGYREPGFYGTLGMPSFENAPSGRDSAATWVASNGAFWLFGGADYEASGNGAQLNDLWTFSPYTGTLPQTGTPVFYPGTGTYTSVQQVTISDPTAGATIFYLIDKAVPPTQYSGPITVASTQTIDAFAVNGSYANSPVATATYTANLPFAAAPAFSVAAGTYNMPQTVAISDAMPDTIIRYTIDQTTPNATSPQYTAPIIVSSSETIEAVAIAPGQTNSVIGEAVYIIWPPSAVNEWAWMGGTNINLEFGVWGTLGMPDVANFPGSRQDSASWTDSSGNFWLFGGYGIDSVGNFSYY